MRPAARRSSPTKTVSGAWSAWAKCEPSRIANSFTLADDVWQLELTVGEERPSLATVALDTAEIRLLFKVSRDEEYVELVVLQGGRAHSFTHRSHIYLLLLLARARLEDQLSPETLPGEHGWLETKRLANMLRRRASRSTSGSGVHANNFRRSTPTSPSDWSRGARIWDSYGFGFGDLATESL